MTEKKTEEGAQSKTGGLGYSNVVEIGGIIDYEGEFLEKKRR